MRARWLLVVAVLLASAAQARPASAMQSPAQRLCGRTVPWDERQELARQLSRQGTLVRVLAQGCPAPAYRASLPLLEEDFARLCRTDDCLVVLDWSSYVAPEETLRLIGRQAQVLLPRVEARVREAREPSQLESLLSRLLGLRREAAGTLAALLMGSFSPGLSREATVLGAPGSPLLVALLEVASRGSQPLAASTAEVLLEQQGHARASSQSFETVMTTLPCQFLMGLQGLSLRPAGRLATVVAQDRESRCWGITARFQKQLAELPPEQVIQELAGASCEVLAYAGRYLGWADAGRAGLLFPWLVSQCPQAGHSVLDEKPMPLLKEVWDGPWRQLEIDPYHRDALAPHVVRLAFAPGNVEALGSKRRVLRTLDAALTVRPADAEVYRQVVEAVTAEPPVVEWFVRVGRMPIPREEMRALFAGPLQSPQVSVRAAAARALAEAGVADIPLEAARACFAEVSASAGCRPRHRGAGRMAYRWELQGELPERRSVRISHGVPLWEQRCSSYRQVAASCPATVCGGAWPLSEQAAAVLKAVTDQDVPAVDDIALHCPFLQGP